MTDLTIIVSIIWGIFLIIAMSLGIEKVRLYGRNKAPDQVERDVFYVLEWIFMIILIILLWDSGYWFIPVSIKYLVYPMIISIVKKTKRGSMFLKPQYSYHDALYNLDNKTIFSESFKEDYAKFKKCHEMGADIEENENNMSPLMTAIILAENGLLFEWRALICELLEHGAGINNTVHLNVTPLMIAVTPRMRHYVMVDQPFKYHLTSSWHPFIESNACEVVEFLIKKGANLDIQNRTGQTALHLAVADANLKIVEILLKKGANAKIKNKDGKTAFDLLEEFRKEKIPVAGSTLYLHKSLEYNPVYKLLKKKTLGKS